MARYDLGRLAWCGVPRVRPERRGRHGAEWTRRTRTGVAGVDWRATGGAQRPAWTGAGGADRLAWRRLGGKPSHGQAGIARLGLACRGSDWQARQGRFGRATPGQAGMARVIAPGRAGQAAIGRQRVAGPGRLGTAWIDAFRLGRHGSAWDDLTRTGLAGMAARGALRSTPLARFQCQPAATPADWAGHPPITRHHDRIHLYRPGR